MSFLFLTSRPSGAQVIAAAHVAGFGVFFAGMAVVLAASYAVVASYGVSIVVLAAVVVVLTTPLSVWAWRSRLTRARLEPDLAELRRQHATDPQRLAEETAALFKEHGVSLWSGFLPSVLPALVFLSAYEAIRGVAHRVRGAEGFRPRYLPHSSRLFHALTSSATMRFWGVDLARSGAAALQLSAWSAGLFLGLVLITVGAAIWQQHLVRSALPHTGDPGPAVARRAGLFLPALFAIWGLGLPLAVTLYYASANVVRLVQQVVIIRTHPW
jgi:YidC/Oxa1 family membrane protein insertase